MNDEFVIVYEMDEKTMAVLDVFFSAMPIIVVD